MRSSRLSTAPERKKISHPARSSISRQNRFLRTKRATAFEGLVANDHVIEPDDVYHLCQSGRQSQRDPEVRLFDKQTLMVIGMAAPIAAGGAMLLWHRRRGNMARVVRRTIRRISHDCLRDIVLPDGIDGAVQIDYLLLTSRGVLVLDVKDIVGAVFAGDNMDQWTVMDSGRRYSIPNPQTAALRRVTAVREIARDIPVHGRIALTPTASFANKPPKAATTLIELMDEFDKSSDSPGQRQVDAFYPEWHKLRRLAEEGCARAA